MSFTYQTLVAVVLVVAVAAGCQPPRPAVSVADDHPHPHGADAHSHGDDGQGAHSHGETADAESHAEDSEFLELSEQSRESLGIEVTKLSQSDYARTLRVPGTIVAIPGVTQLDVTAKVSGQVTKIFAFEGQAVRPGSPLFELRVMHEDAITGQIQLLDALAKMEGVNAEIERLERLEQKSTGSVAGIRLVQQKYERSHLQHTIASRRQMLSLLGIPEADVDTFIERHRGQHHHMDGDSKQQTEKPPLLEMVVIHAPLPSEEDSGTEPLYVIEQLDTRVGQHVELDSALCRLGDYGKLYVEASAFEQDLGIIRRAIGNGWQATAKIDLRDAESIQDEKLDILYISPSVDTASRAARFYVALDNDLLSQAPTGDEHPFVDWKYRPGQRVEVHVPIEEFRSHLVLPADAVVRDGLRQFIFVVDGEHAHQQEVTVQHRDEDVVVLASSDRSLAGKKVVTSGAYQIKLALLNRSSGPVSHGHQH
ncbi:MAG: hypothetical protein CMJ64_19040 [Planctomycetaceae bacterium]|nr:hypothetical protein [Planctomycetaceae bacterium]